MKSIPVCRKSLVYAILIYTHIHPAHSVQSTNWIENYFYVFCQLFFFSVVFCAVCRQECIKAIKITATTKHESIKISVEWKNQDSNKMCVAQHSHIPPWHTVHLSNARDPKLKQDTENNCANVFGRIFLEVVFFCSIHPSFIVDVVVSVAFQ